MNQNYLLSNLKILNNYLQMSHVNLFDLDLTKLKIAKSGRMIKVMYGKEPLQLVTGKLYTPFGVKVNQNNYSPFATCHLDCSLNQSKSEASVKYRESLEALDSKIVELIQESLHLFNTGNQTFQSEDIPNIYSRILRENKTYPKLMKITLPRDSKGNFDCVIFDENKNKVVIEESTVEEILCKGKVFKGIIECGKVWYYNGRFGTTWNLKQLKFMENTPVEVADKTDRSQVYQNIMLLDD
jgi:hypothetical protein